MSKHLVLHEWNTVRPLHISYLRPQKVMHNNFTSYFLHISV